MNGPSSVLASDSETRGSSGFQPISNDCGNQFCNPFLSGDAEPGQDTEMSSRGPCWAGEAVSADMTLTCWRQKQDVLPLPWTSWSSGSLRPSYRKELPVLLNAPISARNSVRFYLFNGTAGWPVRRKWLWGWLRRKERMCLLLRGGAGLFPEGRLRRWSTASLHKEDDSIGSEFHWGEPPV